MQTIIFDLQGTLVEHTNPLVLFPDVIGCLQQLQKEFVLALVTEGKDLTDVKRLLKQLGLDGYFKQVLHLKGTFLEKQDGSGFRKAAELLGVNPTELIVVGDVPFTDIKGAKAIGAKAIRVRRGKYADLEASNEKEEPHLEIKSLRELYPALKCLGWYN